MAAIGKDDLVNEEEQEVITDGPGSVPGEVGAPALGSTRAHFHNPPGGFPSAAEGAADEGIAGPYDDGYANRGLEINDGAVAPSVAGATGWRWRKFR